MSRSMSRAARLSIYTATMVAGIAFFFLLHHAGNQIPYDLAKQRFQAELAATSYTPWDGVYLPVAEKTDPYMRSLHKIRGFRTEVACSLCSPPVRISHTQCS